ncbi:MAG TPA: exonuclease subunit SbcD [Dehalococcoidia bacterium]|nr:exonuclease subunit SbcD [Dehalococcoidia bacterium]
MKLIHFADLHIGVENYSRPDPETGLPSRLLDFLGAFDELVEYALGEQADLVVFAGDAYKTRDPTQTHQREFAKRVHRLASSGIPVYLLIGNHDLPNAAARANALEIFRTLQVENVYLGSRIGTTRVQTRGGPVQIVGVPWPSRSTLLTKEEHRALSIDEVDRKIEEILGDTIRDEAEALDPSIPAILTAHIAMHGSKVKTGSEDWMTVGRFPALQPSVLDADRFDYVALGHHHIQQQVGSRPPMYYAGSMQRVDFGEEHDDKGFMVATLDPALPAGQRVTEVEFRRVRARRFVTVEVTVRGEDATGDVIAAIRRADVRDAIVRVLITLTPPQNAALRDNDVREALAGAHVVATISKSLVQERRRRAFDEASPERMAPLDALGRYFDSRETPADYREQLLSHARVIVEGVNEPE